MRSRFVGLRLALRDLFRRQPPEPPAAPSLLYGMAVTTGADELARRERLRRIHGDAPSWLDRPERDALRCDLRSYPQDYL